MKNDKLRQFMLKNRVFLHSLYSDSKSERTHRLNSCSNTQANLLLHILRKIVQAEISLEPTHFEKLKKSRKLYILNELKSDATFSSLLKGPRQKKVDFLKKLNLLRRPFNSLPMSDSSKRILFETISAEYPRLE